MAVFAPFLIQLFVAIALSIISYALMPKPKTAKPAAATDMESPTADAGREVPVVFGQITVKGTNILWYGDKAVLEWSTS